MRRRGALARRRIVLAHQRIALAIDLSWRCCYRCGCIRRRVALRPVVVALLGVCIFVVASLRFWLFVVAGKFLGRVRFVAVASLLSLRCFFRWSSRLPSCCGECVVALR